MGCAALAALALAACIPAEPTPTLFVIPTLPPLPGGSPTGILGPTEEAAPTGTPVAAARTPTATPTGSCVPDAEFDADITIPDDTVLAPGEEFTKTWRIRNTGTCTWNSRYSLVFAGQTLMGPFVRVPLPITLAGRTADISIDLVAPTRPGTYSSVWRLVTPEGTRFGFEPYVQIVVSASASRGPGGPSAPLPNSYPAISGITYHSRQIYLAGKGLGNRPNVFSKVGDSTSAEWYFLTPLGDGDYDLREYGYLEPALSYFRAETARTGNSFNNVSLAAVGGWPAFGPLEPSLADPACAGAAPLDCEFNAVKPSLALIMLGTNDIIQGYPPDYFDANLARVVQRCIDLGVIPVLYTLPWIATSDVTPFNAAILRTARAYDVPLVDYYAVLEERGLNHGVRDDGIHPSIPPHGNPAIFGEDELQYGYTIRNLLTLQLLDVLWRQVLAY